jgi:hypothetical protein
LYNIKDHWKNISSILSLNVEKTFNKSHQEILNQILKNYLDQSSQELVQKFIKANYINIYNTDTLIKDIPNVSSRSNPLSFLFCNIYFQTLDRFIIKYLIPRWTKKKRCFISKQHYFIKKNIKTKKLTVKFYPELSKTIRVNKIKKKLHNKKIYITRLHYTRYANHFILGFTGNKVNLIKIFEELKFFLFLRLRFEFDKNRSYLSPATNGCKFLEVILKWDLITSKTKLKKLNSEPQVLSEIKNLTIPIHDLLKKAVKNGFGTYKTSNRKLIRATSKQSWCVLEKEIIVNYFNVRIKHLLDYYQLISKKSTLWSIISLYRKSCALTLARKLKLNSASQIFNKFGKSLRIENKLEKTSTSLNAYPMSLKMKKNLNHNQNNQQWHFQKFL